MIICTEISSSMFSQLDICVITYMAGSVNGGTIMSQILDNGESFQCFLEVQASVPLLCSGKDTLHYQQRMVNAGAGPMYMKCTCI